MLRIDKTLDIIKLVDRKTFRQIKGQVINKASTTAVNVLKVALRGFL